MSSEAITRNDLTNILNGVLPPTPSEYRKLLWTNPSPTSSFAAQTVSLDLSDYDEVEIAVRLYSGGSSPVTFARGSVGLLSSALGVRNDSFLTQIRQFTPQTSGVQFYDCKLGSNGSTYNDQMIPLNIYGIKYERVAPPQVEYPTYSTEEQQVDTWINGKPIYRKVYTGLSFGGTTAAWADTGATITNVANMISCRGLGADFQPLMGFRVNSNKIQYWCGQSWAGTTSIIIEYTKTTD